MTEQPTEQNTDDVQPEDSADEHVEEADTTGQDNSGNPEAAKYRRKLRAAEAERDAALTELTELKRRNIMDEYSLNDDHMPFLNTTGTLEEFEQSAKAYREVNRTGVVFESGTGWAGLGDDGPSWSDAIGNR